MARLCTLCGRQPLPGFTRSHSNIASKRRRHINLQTIRVDGQRRRACTSCVRTQTKRLVHAAA